MKIGQLVKTHIKKIFNYCDTVDHDELLRLMDAKYSKTMFDINFPFCIETSNISLDQSKRNWTTNYLVRGKTVRVSSQWFDKSKSFFSQYLLAKGIVSKDKLSLHLLSEPTKTVASYNRPMSSRLNSRYRGNAIGNAQNLLVRNILSNLGQESFSDKDWYKTRDYFSNCCAYCGKEGDLVMEHAVPINRQSLGEHRLGNLVPSCRHCNSIKADKDYRDFLDNKSERIEKIEAYMDANNYVPLGDNEQVKVILDMAYREVSSVADRYITILNELFPKD